MCQQRNILSPLLSFYVLFYSLLRHTVTLANGNILVCTRVKGLHQI